MKRKVFFTITGRPASKKNSRKYIRRGGKHFSVPSDAYNRYATEFKAQILEMFGTKPPKISGPAFVMTMFEVKGRYQFDADNYHTGILDLLEDVGIIEDDKNVFIGSYQKATGRPDWATHILINPLPDDIEEALCKPLA